jgi:hypothetical protein
MIPIIVSSARRELDIGERQGRVCLSRSITSDSSSIGLPVPEAGSLQSGAVLALRLRLRDLPR